MSEGPDLDNNFRTGQVFLDAFHRGVIETMGGFINTRGDTYVVTVPDVEPPPDPNADDVAQFEGVPIYFAWPDETIDIKIIPSFIVRCDSFTPAMGRWHQSTFAYRVPAVGANPVTIKNPITGNTVATGYDAYEQQDQAVPYDLLYNIQIKARFRNNLGVSALKMLRFLMKRYQPYTIVKIKDSLGDTRTYDAFAETPSPVDMMPDVAGRETNFNYTLRVEGELDINDPYVTRAVTTPIVRTNLK